MNRWFGKFVVCISELWEYIKAFKSFLLIILFGNHIDKVEIGL